MDKRFKAAKKFQSTLPARGATAQPKYIPRSRRDFNPRSPHGERRHGEQKNMRHRMISIHAPRTGSDGNADEMTAASRISIHAPRTGSDRHRLELLRPHGDFNPRSPHGERPARAVRRRLTGHFNPRSPHGERPAGSIQHILHRTISIHAPRTGSDSLLQQNGRTGRHFNPRSPHGERHVGFNLQVTQIRFQSTLPARGATRGWFTEENFTYISIHAPRRGSDA